MARAEAERALANDASDGAANNLLANLLYRPYQWEEARRVVDRALSYNPGSSAMRMISATLLAEQGRTPEALVEARRAVDLDPRYWANHGTLGFLHTCTGENDAAVEDLERAWELAPGAPFLRELLADAYHRSGKDEAALQAATRELPPELVGLEDAMTPGFRQAGFQGASRRALEWRVASSGDHCTGEAVRTARTLAMLGEADWMFECLREAIDRRDRVFLKADPAYNPFRADPRFAALLRRMNLAE